MTKKVKTILMSIVAAAALMAGCAGPTTGAFLAVDNNQCIGCSECVNVCATKAIRVVNNKAILDPASCTECGKCVTVCPKDAIF